MKDHQSAPIIIVNPEIESGIEVIAGRSFSLDADVKGKPTPSKSWYKNDAALTSVGRIQIEDALLSTTIKIKDTNRTDSGTYKIFAENSVGSWLV